MPFVQHVSINGQIKKEVTEFAGRQAKPKATPSESSGCHPFKIKPLR